MKKIVSLMLAIVLCFSCCLMADAASVDVAQYIDWNFYGKSAPELIALQLDCDTVSFYATTEDNSEEVLTCHIVDLTHDGAYNQTFPFLTDGSVTTFAYAFPIGEYRIYFTGGDSVKKTLAVATFTQLD